MSDLAKLFPMNLSIDDLKIDLAFNKNPLQFLNYYKSIEIAHSKWSPVPPDDFYTLEYWKKTIPVFEEKFHSGDELRTFIMNGGEVVGSVNFTNGRKGCFWSISLGYGIHPDYQGRGIATKAVKQLIPIVFHELGYHRVEAGYIPENIGSGKVLSKLGFKEIGISPYYLKINNAWQDHMLTALTIEDWN